ncbi:26S proteasome regulatory subunit 6A [Serendipita sp. 400]|nr:26S proteasome regulatory subunit 6A [Serendipita sp. 400]
MDPNSKGRLDVWTPRYGKMLLDKVCAAQTSACYLKLAGPSLEQMFIVDGAKLVRDALALAKEKVPVTSSLTNWTPLGQNVSIRIKAMIEKYNRPCWNSSIS